MKRVIPLILLVILTYSSILYGTTKQFCSDARVLNVRFKEKLEQIAYNTPTDDDWKYIKELVEAGADVDIVTERTEGRGFISALHLAVWNHNNEIVQYLIDHNAHINAMDIGGDTPLHHAARCKNYKAAEILLCHGADQSIIDDNTMTALDIARIYTKDQKMVDLLQN